MRFPKYKRRFAAAAKHLRITKTALAARLGISHNHFFCVSRGERALGIGARETLLALELQYPARMNNAAQ